MGFFPTFKFEFFCPSSSMQIGCKVKVKGIFWPPRPDIILVSRFLPENLIWPQISSEIGPQWTRQSLICNMCGRIFPQVASFKKHTICSCQHIMNIHFIASFSTNISSKVGLFLIIYLDICSEEMKARVRLAIGIPLLVGPWHAPASSNYPIATVSKYTFSNCKSTFGNLGK